MALRVGATEQCFGATLSAANVGVLRPPANLPDEVLGPGSAKMGHLIRELSMRLQSEPKSWRVENLTRAGMLNSDNGI